MDKLLESTFYVAFTTKAFATGVPTTLLGTPVISAYEDAGLTQITSGLTLGVDHDAVTGLNMITIVATTANGFEAGKDYQLVITTGTVDGVSVVGEVVGKFGIQNSSSSLNSSALAALEDQYDGTGNTGDTFPSTQAQLGSITNTGSAVNRAADSYTLTTGTQTVGSYTDTEELDGSYHTHTDTAGAIELYYEFIIGAGSPSSAQITGYLQGTNDDVGVYGYDWVTASFKQIGTMNGTAIATVQVNSYDLFVNMVGSGTDIGKVRIRFYEAAGLTSATLAIDQILVKFNQAQAGYEGAAIWADSNAANINVVVGIDGIANKPVSTEAAINTLLASTNQKRVEVYPGSSFAFATSHVGEVWNGDNYSIALGGQDVSKTHIEHSNPVTGTGTTPTGEAHIIRSHIGAVTIGECHISDCTFTSTFTLSAAGDYFIENSKSGIAGPTAPVFDMGAAVGATNLGVRDWRGGLTINNLASGDVVTLDGIFGTITLNGADATVEIRGIYKSIVDNLTGTPSVNFEGALNTEQTVDDIWDEPLTGATHNVTDSSGKRIRDLQEWGSYEGGAIFIDTVNGSAGTTDYESGTILNPVDTIADANTLAASLNLPRFEIAPASSITFAASQIGQIFNGIGWTLLLGGQDISNSEIIGAQSVSGIATTPTGEVHFIDCEVVSGTLGQAHLKFCGLGGTITLSDAANYTLSNCYSQIPGSPTPIIDFGAAVGNTGLSMRSYSGGIEVQNYGTTGIDTMSIEGNGQLIIAASCTGGTIFVRGNFKVTDNSGAAVTIVYDDNTANTISILEDTSTTLPGLIDDLAIKKNTAFSNFEFLMVLTSDHVTPATGLTVTGQRSIDGGAFAAVSGAIAEVSNGIYQFDALAADTNGDVITWRFLSGTADDAFITFKTIA